MGYDRRALAGWTAISTVVLLACYFLAPAPPAPPGNPNLAVNINYVHGLSDVKPQTWLPPWLWLTSFIVGFPVAFYLPAHLVFRSLFAKQHRDGSTKPNFAIDREPIGGIGF